MPVWGKSWGNFVPCKDDFWFDPHISLYEENYDNNFVFYKDHMLLWVLYEENYPPVKCTLLAETRSESMAFHICSIQFSVNRYYPACPNTFFFYNYIIYSHARTKIPSLPLQSRSYHVCQCIITYCPQILSYMSTHCIFFFFLFHLPLPPVESHIKACQGPCLNKQGRLGTLIQSVIYDNYCMSLHELHELCELLSIALTL